ncbi:ATP-dependent DNA helicase RecG [Streptosporangium sp. NBC_01639]|uniref:ATP-dependent DNA helicase RecG n=1 Tax=unclassified Streptosporangium TaxID=2632669 RepID=UPI002DDA281C|nr:ATP-dependent DNA helicase RecG [Streptosporangium sp. NBC_01756]WSC88779.1 ATP-dependent DNA helicase RecG [Streptosporangium sp. NBC_01756]WTD52532.1 ATP-dependent DNA helicase RecG [Streptosporangium sp. NBC_01639]
MTSFDEPLAKALDPKTAKLLDSVLGLRTVGDLLRHYPRRYAERGELTDLDDLQVDEHVTVVGEVTRAMRKPMRNKGGTWLEVEVVDGRRSKIYLSFFGRTSHLAESRLRPGARGMFAGRVGAFGQGEKRRWQLSHPEFEMFDETEAGAEEFAAALVPIYPAGKDVTPWAIRRALGVVLDTMGALDDPLPAGLRARHGLPGLAEALLAIHRPRDHGDVTRARKRLKFDEAFLLQAVLLQRRMAAASWPATPRPPRGDGLLADFDGRLPFQLTEGQQSVGEEVAADLALAHPMHRLLQGEVGAGKTVVALRAMLQVVDAGGQAVLLAPTEVLAQQHHRSISGMLGDLAAGGMFGGTAVALLTGSLGAAARRSAMLDAASGTAGIVVGTHAVLQERVQFADLGLVVVDEQHRFGVEQRDALREKAGGGRPHVLVMTATPIPRTVAMTVFGDLTVSTLSQLPSGRAPITTHVVPAAEKPHFLDRTWTRLREEIELGRQAYIVCPRIGDLEGDEGDLSKDDDERRPPLAVLDVAEMLSEGPLRGLRTAVLHGKLPPEEKDAVMRAFTRGEIDVLVATTVIEVGVDVPNSSVMVIMDADRFGVSQLHQLRGRVGRGGLPGLCLLVTDSPGGTPARQRLDAVAATLDGFELSRVDLEQRREGDVLGVAQSGRRSSLKMLQLLRDEDVIHAARLDAEAMLEADPGLADHPVLRTEIDRLLADERAEYLEKT